MKITGVEVIQVGLPAKHPWRLRFVTFERYNHVIVKIQTDEGIVGLGESSNGSLFFTESQGTTFHIIKDHLSPLIVGEDPFNIEKILEKMDQVGSSRIYPLYPYAKSAVDTALYDIMGKALGVPIYKLLGGCYRKKIPITPSIGLQKSKDDLVKEVTKYLEKGFQFGGVKLKAGIDPKKDFENVRTVREVLGEEKLIISDPNAAYSPKTAIRIIRQMEQYGPIIMEQPVAGWDLDGMAEVVRAVETPIAADESIWAPQHAIEIIKKRAADILHLYDDKSGGLFNTKRIALIAESANIPCIVGEVGSGISTAAVLHLVAATKNVSLPCQILGPMYLKDDIIESPFIYENGHLKVPEKPGLGVSLDEEKLRKYRIGMDRLHF